MPTPLATLPSDQPIPNGRCQIKIGANEAAKWVDTNWAGVAMEDGAGGVMQITYTPRYRCRWIVRSNVISCGVSGAWQRWDHEIWITPADVIGVTKTVVITDDYDSSTVGWNGFAGRAVFELAAGVAYTAKLVNGYSSGGTQQYYCGAQYLRLIGHAVGEGVI